jgi:prepilin-type N-terminal cleavage/methylation domain-containing protein
LADHRLERACELFSMKRHYSCRNRSAGLTLVELVLVLMISSIIAAIVVPRYGGAVNKYRADAAARRVANDLSYARARACALSTSRSVVFNVTTGICQLTSESALNGTDAYSVNLASDPYYVSIGTANFNGSTTATFNGFGVPLQSGSVKVICGTASRTISIDPDTGEATVQ